MQTFFLFPQGKFSFEIQKYHQIYINLYHNYSTKKLKMAHPNLQLLKSIFSCVKNTIKTRTNIGRTIYFELFLSNVKSRVRKPQVYSTNTAYYQILNNTQTISCHFQKIFRNYHQIAPLFSASETSTIFSQWFP